MVHKRLNYRYMCIFLVGLLEGNMTEEALNIHKNTKFFTIFSMFIFYEKFNFTRNEKKNTHER